MVGRTHTQRQAGTLAKWGVLALLAPMAGASADPPRPAALILRTLVTEPTVSIAGRQRMTRKRKQGDDAVVEFRVQRAPHGRLRVEPLSGDARVTVCDGKRRWTWYPARNIVIETSLFDEPDPRREAELIARNFILRDGGGSVVAGRRCRVILVEDKREKDKQHPLIARLHIDGEKYVRLKTERFRPEDRARPVFTVEFTEVRYDPVFKEADFVFRPPAGAEVKRLPTPKSQYTSIEALKKNAGLPLHTPTSLPGGFEFINGALKDKREVWLRYSNGLSRLSLFQRPVPQDEPAESEPRFLRMGAISWNSKGTKYMLVGVAPPPILNRVIKALTGKELKDKGRPHRGHGPPRRPH